ncbi:hypothetical protein N2152v2_000850 [Parachlorella kessleri]
MVQDYLFVREFVRFAALVLSKAPPENFDVLLGGLGALKDELAWFQDVAKDRNLSLDAKSHANCQQYIQFMTNCSKQPYPVAAVAFWAIERAYHEAWSKHCPMKEPYHTFGQRWGSAAFGAYVEALGLQADEALEQGTAAQRDEAEVAFLKICELERGFWDMACAT